MPGLMGIAKNKYSKIFLTIFIVVLIGLSIVLSHIELPYTIRAYCKIQPVQKWVLTTGTNGQLSAGMVDYKSGTSKGYKVSQFAREGTMKLTFRPLIETGNFIRVGDTIATIYSSETEESLANLKGQIATLKATLAADIKGEKESIVREYELRLSQAQEEEANQRIILNRHKSMFENNLISQQEYDIASNQESLLVVGVEIARSQLEAARTGAKREQIDLLNTQITALENDLEALNKRIESFLIISPISGKISRQYSAETLLVISDVTSYVALIPFKIREASHVSPNLKVRIQADGAKQKILGRLVFLDREVIPLGGEQACVGTAVIAENTADLSPGMFCKCVVHCEPVNVLEYIWAFLRTY